MTNFREEAENYIEYGITTLKEILADCKEIARTDKEAEATMVEQAGSVEQYAERIYEAI